MLVDGCDGVEPPRRHQLKSVGMLRGGGALRVEISGGGQGAGVG